MASSTSTTTAEPAPTLWTPLSLPVFRLLWIAMLTENVCSWLLDMTNGWLMTSLSPSPLMVSLVQTASLLPILLFALPSGALTDIVSRRTILLWVEGALAVFNGALALLAHLDLLTGPVLLGLIFANGVAFAFGMPVWQAVTAEVVPAAQLSSAFLLNGIAVNIARGIGPVLAGVLLATAGGPVLAFAVNCAGFFFVWFAVRSWPVALAAESRLPSERVLSAIVAGLRYARFDANLRTVLFRVTAFVFFATGFWAVAPLIGRGLIKLDALGYGLWMTTFGLGAIMGGYLMSRVVAVININVIVALNTAMMGAGMVAIGLAPIRAVAFPVMFAVGVAWMMTLGSFVMAVQSNVPSWVRGRAVAIYFMAFQGVIALSAAMWGLIAQEFGLAPGLIIAATGLIVALAATAWWKLSLGDSSATVLHGLFPTLELAPTLDASQTAAMVTFEYRILEADRASFLALAEQAGVVRQRNGATQWGVFEDLDQPGRWMESFVVDSSAEMERIRQRTTTADYAILQRLYALHQGGGSPPAITRFLAAPTTS
jgi:MFS family permease